MESAHQDHQQRSAHDRGDDADRQLDLIEVTRPPTRASRNSAAVPSRAPANALTVSDAAPIPVPTPNRMDAAAGRRPRYAARGRAAHAIPSDDGAGSVRTGEQT
ncbi:MAG: hypothetical protein ACRDRK_03975 [Pseudonocardia sp.]